MTLDLPAVLATTWEVLRRRGNGLVTLAALGCVLSVMAELVLGVSPFDDTDHEFSYWLLATGFLAGTPAMATEAALVALVLDDLTGREPSLDGLGPRLSAALPLVLVLNAVFLLVYLNTVFLLFLPLILLGAALYVVIPVAMAEAPGAMAVRRAWTLGAGHRRELAILTAVQVFIGFVVTLSAFSVEGWSRAYIVLPYQVLSLVVVSTLSAVVYMRLLTLNGEHNVPDIFR